MRLLGRTLKWRIALALVALVSAVAWGVDWVSEEPPTAPPGRATTESEIAQEPEVAIDWEKSHTAALERAGREKRPVMIEFFTTWQHWCRVFEEKTLGDAKVAELSRQLIMVRVDAKEEESLARKYRVTSHPTIIFLNARGELIHRIIGFVPPEPFLHEMKQIAEGREPEKEFEELKKSNPKEFRPLVMLAVGYQKRHEWDKAIETYERALRAGPGLEERETQDVIYALSQLYDYRKKPEKAEPLLRDLLATRTADKAKVYETLGHVYLSLRKPQEAIEQFRAERELVDEPKQREIDLLIQHIERAQERQPK